MITSREQQTLSESLASYCAVQMELSHVESEIARINRLIAEAREIRERIDQIIARFDGRAKP